MTTQPVVQFFRFSLKSILVGSVAALAIACQEAPPNPLPTDNPTPTASPTATPTPPTSPASPQASQNTYTNEQFNFRFEYPASHVLDASSANQPASTEENLRASIQLWRQTDYQGLQNNKFEGSEFPANVSVSVYENPKRLALREWIEQSPNFVSPSNYESLTVSGQSALAFDSTGLYESRNVVLNSSDETNIILIRIELIGVAENDTDNRQAFDRVLSSFSLF